MRTERISIKWKLIMYMTCFVIAEFLLLSAFHMFFLDSFYRNIKINELKSTAKTVQAGINSENMDEVLKSAAREGGMCIEIFDQTGSEMHYVEGMPFGVIREMNADDRKRLFEETVESGTKIYYESMNFYDQRREKIADRNNAGEPRKVENDNLRPEREFSFAGEDTAVFDGPDSPNIIILSQTAQIDGKNVIIVLSTALTPLFATRQILNVETMYVCGVLLIFSTLLAFLIYRKISRPIMKTNGKAVLLANGNYNVRFDSDGYREIKELNDTLTFAASELNKTEKLRQDLMANISHDLRTPLTMIRGYAELMRDIPGEATEGNIQIIIDETNRLSNLVTDILDISKLQSGVMELNREGFSITESIKGVLGRYGKLKEQEGYRIEFLYESDVWINADTIKMSQVLYNLINNAINYTGDDRRVTVRQTVNGSMVKIEVEDTGDGIDENDIRLIWDRYYKIDKNHKRPVSGTGLGLSIVKNVLELHGFEYGVDSQKGKGSVFYFEAEILSRGNKK